jgi:RecA-family ATPase
VAFKVVSVDQYKAFLFEKQTREGPSEGRKRERGSGSRRRPAKLRPERREAIANIAQQQKLPVKPSGLLTLTWIHQTEDDDQRHWLVYGIFAKGEMWVIFGEPSAGKSIIAGDVALHVAHGMPWCGMETTKAPVLYYAAERAKLIKRRIAG